MIGEMLASSKLHLTINVLLPYLLLPLLSLSASVPFKEIINSDDSANVLSWHRLSECPSDSTNFVHDKLTDPGHCVRRSGIVDGKIDYHYQCGSFRQYCFNRSMKITCKSYSRSCDTSNECQENYQDCTTEITDHTLLVEKATGVPAKVYAECIPAVEALRDQCNSSFTCNSTFSYDPDTDELTSCRIVCTPIDMTCYNYTRSCTEEISEVINTAEEQKIKIETADCEVITRERRLDEHMVWDNTELSRTDEGEVIKVGAIIINRTVYVEWDKEESWENCDENTKVPYEPMCNQFISHMMDPLRDVVYDPHAHDLVEGIRTFLSLWNDGYKILCDFKFNCFVQLIKYSRICWPGLPLQRFLPGADYASLESLLKNMTRLACRTTPSPPVKFKGNETYLNARNSCVSFFDVESGITKPLYKKFLLSCANDDIGVCSPECNQTLNEYAARFGCCIGSIVNEYKVNKHWYMLFNFADNAVIRKLETCGTERESPCEEQDPAATSLVVSIVRNFLYIIGGIMAVVCVAMTASFYWQLEHEPIKKAFYHF